MIKILSAYRENILILSEHVQILEQIFVSEVIRNHLYLSNLSKWVKNKNCSWKKKDISEQYVSITGWVMFFEKWQGYFVFTIFPIITSTDFHVEATDRLCLECGSIIMKNGHHILPVLKEAMSLTFERSINLLENMTPSNICHSCWTQEVSAIQRCPPFRGVRHSEVSAIQRCPPFRGVRYSEVFI